MCLLAEYIQLKINIADRMKTSNQYYQNGNLFHPFEFLSKREGKKCINIVCDIGEIDL